MIPTRAQGTQRLGYGVQKEHEPLGMLMPFPHVSYSLNSLKGGNTVDYKGEYYKG